MIRKPPPRRRSAIADALVLAGGALGLALLAAQPIAAEDARNGGALQGVDGLLLPWSQYGGSSDEPDATGTLIEPPIGERPSPAEAREADLEDRILMRPPGGQATGGRPDIPVER